ncbi:T9SS outer membrane translocon Sov/SprA [Brumimicrobium mesophilum]|uniref:T9SS outer membrane translocon Sov/SprA n=1 Tax=Brumimicrobium mesophilum TaxID=392717 RepID=UPI00131C2F97|nr:cell surface protein SprA [Brumimicrobium mesophilum]
MNRQTLNTICSGFLITLIITTLTFAYGQGDPDSTKLKFPIKNPYDPTGNDRQSFDLGDPKSVQKSIVYDPKTGKYVFKEVIGGIDYKRGSMMTLEEYIEYERQQKMQSYWKEKIDSQTEEEQGLIPPIKIDSPGFANIFGSDEILIRPEGSVELSLGLNSARYDNPVLPENQRRITRFDFQQQIQLNLVGQIGTKLKLGASYNTEAAFNFDNVTKLEWTGEEDQILQKIEAGNVSMPLETSLIEGSQTLFGVKTRMRFGRLTVDAIASTSRGQKQEINIKGGSQVQDFELKADDYEANRHYFLNYYHRENYDQAMESVPFISSLVNITRIEVWVTNQTNKVEDTRNIIAFTDLGEADPDNWSGNPGSASTNELPNNSSNGLYDYAKNNPTVRGFNNAVVALESEALEPGPFQQANDYEKVENARRLTEQEFTYNAQLGFISVNLPLNNDEVLAVSYEYTYAGRTYQVGEFSTDGIVGTDALFLKLLKPTIVNPKNKLWDLMMKNVYSIGAYQVSQEGFRLDILYNNPDNSLLVNFLPYPGLDDKQVIDVVGMDRLNQNNRSQKDGVFDFLPITFNGNQATNGGTINTRNGRIYFSTIEPFAETVRKEMIAAGLPQIADNVAYDELYDSTKIAAQQIPKKNRFYFVGKYESSVSDEIPLNALNVPEGAVVVTAGGIRLQEGQDFTVDYNLGRVKILNSAVLESNADIKISIESNSVFGFQNKSLIGTHMNYMINPDFNVGATWMRMTEKPITQKVDIGDEPFKNNIVGANLSYRTDIPLLTKLINFIPTISTKQMSTLTLNAEAAHLIPGTPRAISKQGISYVDDFEGSQSTIDLKNFSSWKLASIPQGQDDLFPEASLKNNLAAGFKRSHLSWYSIDPMFHENRSITPQHIADDPTFTENMNVSLVNKTDIFPNTQPATGEITNLPIFNMTYYPKDRGMYNYDTTNTVNAEGEFTDPQERWNGIMRSLTTTNFEETNVEYIQFWLLDPFNEDQQAQDPTTPYSGGDLYFNIGNLSEDILPDSRKSFENGLPREYDNTLNTDVTNWARVSTQQVVVNAFDNDPETRAQQDVGLDGYDDEKERLAYASYVNWIQTNSVLSPEARAELLRDISGDNYNYYRDDQYDADERDIIRRYKYWNGHEGNSPTPEMSAQINSEGYPTQATNTPDMEDVNRDNNLSESESYFQYKVSLRQSDLVVGKNYIINTREYDKNNKNFKWYQFRVPIRNPEKAVNGISDYRSIRFMRMFMRSFEQETTLRFAKLELVRGEWRKFTESLTQPGDGVQEDPDLTPFNIGAVNVEEHDQREPIKYVIPPGIDREVDPSQQFQRQLNEQSMTIEVCNLKDGDARGATKNVGMDMIMYKNLEMYLHAEEVEPTNPLNDEDVTVFIRLGTDFRENYYEYEVPMTVSQWGVTQDLQIWPEENNLRIVFEDLINLKKERNTAMEQPGSNVATNIEYSKEIAHKPGTSDNNDVNHPPRMVKIKGNPNLVDVKTIMIGVRNPAQNADNPWKPDDGLAKCVQVWVNELRLTEFQNEGGSAALAQAQLQIADFATVQVAGAYSGLNWGSIDSRVAERQRDTRLSLDVSANAQLGQLLGDKAKIDIPFLYTYSVGTVRPRYDPYNPDIELSSYDSEERKQRMKDGSDFTQRKSFNFTNVRRQRKPGAEANIWDISNFSLNFAYSEDYARNFTTNYDRTKIWKGGVNYVYNGSPTLWEPFKQSKFMRKSKWWGLLQSTNFYLGPKNISVKNNLIRNYNERQIANNIPNTDFEFQPIYLKNFTWNRRFDFGYDITRNLKFDFASNNTSIIDEAEGQVDKNESPELYRDFQDSVRTQLRTLGKTMRYDHNYNLTYNVPFNKIPALDFINSNIRYGGAYEWTRPNLGQEVFGNTIQNSRNINTTAQLNLLTLYRKSDFLKKIVEDGRGGRESLRTPQGAMNRGTLNRPGSNPVNTSRLAKKVRELTIKKEKLERVRVNTLETDELVEHEKELAKVTKKLENKEPRLERQDDRIANQNEREEKYNDKFGKPYHPVVGFAARALMSVRTVSGTYTQTDGMLLPGFNQEADFFGLNSAMLGDSKLRGFAIGQQQRSVFGNETGFDYAPYAGANGFIVDTSGLNTQHTIMHSQNYNLRASIEPIKDLKIDLSMQRNFTENTSSYFRFSDSLQAFENQSEFKTTTVSYSTISIRSAFERLDKNDDYRSPSFDNIRERRAEVSQLLGEGNPYSLSDSAGYTDGYGPNQQDVLIGAFLNTFSGKNTNKNSISPVRSVPLPNWQVSYNGLTKFKFFKKYVQNFTLRHGYTSTVNVSGMQTNLNAEVDDDGYLSARDINNNFISEQQIQNVTISERFSPLIGFDATWKVNGNGLLTKFEISKERASSLSLANNQLTELIGTEIVIGTGYKFTNFRIPITVRGDRLKPSDLNVRFDLSIRDNITVIRKVVENTTQATAGQRVFSIRSSADYLVGKNLTVSLYYDQQLTDPTIATSYVTGNIATGVRLRFNLGGL